jgi:hypothetical protein
MFKRCIQDFVVAKLPPSVSRNRDGTIMVEKVEKYAVDHSKSKDKDFMRALLKTQLFNFFIDEFY